MKVTVGATSKDSILARPQRVALQVRVLRIAICGQIRIKRFLDYDKSAPGGQAIESRSGLLFADSAGRAVSASEAGRRGHSIWHCVKRISRVRYLCKLNNFGPKISSGEKNRRSRCSIAQRAATFIAT